MIYPNTSTGGRSHCVKAHTPTPSLPQAHDTGGRNFNKLVAEEGIIDANRSVHVAKDRGRHPAR